MGKEIDASKFQVKVTNLKTETDAEQSEANWEKMSVEKLNKILATAKKVKINLSIDIEGPGLALLVDTIPFMNFKRVLERFFTHLFYKVPFENQGKQKKE